ncbi:MAG: hypothetical protein H6711_03695 [Myxococcales bacterium]|nr:hypothetical protein [Myxococcales bacterium]
MTTSRGPRWLALTLGWIVTVGACERGDDGSTSVAGTDGAGESAGDDLSDDDDEAPLTCAEMTCPQDSVCINPPAYCDESEDPPVLRRDDAYCRPITSGGGASAAIDDVTLIGLARPECDLLTPALAWDAAGQAIITCPDIQLPCE